MQSRLSRADIVEFAPIVMKGRLLIKLTFGLTRANEGNRLFRRAPWAASGSAWRACAIFKPGREEKLVFRSAWTSGAQAIQLQNALEVREQDLDLLPLASGGQTCVASARSRAKSRAPSFVSARI